MFRDWVILRPVRIRIGGTARAALLTIAVMVAANLVFYGPGIVTGDELFFTNEAAIGYRSVGSDIWHLHYPVKSFYAEELRRFRLPFWCPAVGTGFPLFAEGQVGALYPFNLVLFGLLPLPLAFNLFIVSHVVLAGVFTAMYAHQLGASRSASALAGLVLGFSGFFVTHLKHINMVAAAAWAPLLLFLLESHARNRRVRTGVMLGLSVSVMALAGHPQIAYFNLVILGLYTAYLAVSMLRPRAISFADRSREALRFTGGVLYATAFGVLLAAPQLVPSAQLNSLGPRRDGLTFEQATELGLSPSHLVTFVRPHHFGDPGSSSPPAGFDPPPGPQGEPASFDVRATGSFFWEITAYVGILPLILAVLALVLARHKRSHRLVPPLVLLIPSLLLALGKYGLLARVLYAVVPGFHFFRFYSRFLVYVDLSVAVLAGIGLTLLLESFAHRRRLVVAAAGAAFLVCFADLYLTLADHNPRIAATRWSLPPASVRTILAEESAREQPFRLLSFDPRGVIFANAYYRAGGWKRDLSPYDVAREMVHPNLNLLYDVPAMGFYFPTHPSWMDAWLDPSLYNVRYVLVPHSESRRLTPFRASGHELIGEFPGDTLLPTGEPFDIRLYRNEAAMPRAFLVSRPLPVRDDGQGRRILGSEDFDPRLEVVVHGEPGPDSAAYARQPVEGTVRFHRYEAQMVDLRVVTPRDSWLFLSDTYYPEWEATVDGQATPVYRANIAGRAIRVPEGTHSVVFAYRARGFRQGLILAAGGLALLLLWPVRRGLAARWRRSARGG